MTDGLVVRGTYIQNTFTDYLDNVFWVNRKYQRKLVWTLEEKQSFIDTILRGYPVPTILLAKYKLDGEDDYRKEIIDGLQRLNAIFSFIKNEFPVKWGDGEYYFNPAAMVDAGTMIAEGILIQKENKLDVTLCRKFLNYELPITTTEVSDTEIEDIFIRINSSGRKLSSQDLRQASAVGPFSDLVRKTACYIRGDITEGDIVPLAEMPALSLSNRKLNYEIRVSDTFWIQNGIITEKNIRLSRDEEIIARIYSYMILGESVSPSSNALTNMYDMKSAQNHKLNSYVEQRGISNIMDRFSKIYADFNKLFESVNSDFSSWIFKNYNAKGKAKVFQAIFLALYELRKDMTKKQLRKACGKYSTKLMSKKQFQKRVKEFLSYNVYCDRADWSKRGPISGGKQCSGYAADFGEFLGNIGASKSFKKKSEIRAGDAIAFTNHVYWVIERRGDKLYTIEGNGSRDARVECHLVSELEKFHYVGGTHYVKK